MLSVVLPKSAYMHSWQCSTAHFGNYGSVLMPGVPGFLHSQFAMWGNSKHMLQYNYFKHSNMLG
jgi:hypothetical protein